jgi:hypothetical protein
MADASETISSDHWAAQKSNVPKPAVPFRTPDPQKYLDLHPHSAS